MDQGPPPHQLWLCGTTTRKSRYGIFELDSQEHLGKPRYSQKEGGLAIYRDKTRPPTWTISEQYSNWLISSLYPPQEGWDETHRHYKETTVTVLPTPCPLHLAWYTILSIVFVSVAMFIVVVRVLYNKCLRKRSQNTEFDSPMSDFSVPTYRLPSPRPSPSVVPGDRERTPASGSTDLSSSPLVTEPSTPPPPFSDSQHPPYEPPPYEEAIQHS